MRLLMVNIYFAQNYSLKSLSLTEEVLNVSMALLYLRRRDKNIIKLCSILIAFYTISGFSASQW